MKNFSFFVLLFYFSFCSAQQNPQNEKAEQFFFNGKYTEAISIRKKILESINDKNSDAYKKQAYNIKLAESYLTSDYSEMLHLVEEAIAIFNSKEEKPPEKKIQLGIEYYNVLIPTGNLKKAWKVASETYDLVLSQNNAEKYGEQIAKTLQGLGNIKWFMQEYQYAIPYFKKAIEKTTEVYGYYSLKTAENYRLLAILYSFTPNFNAGFDYGLKAQEIYEKINPDDKFLLFQQYANNLSSSKKYGDLERVEELMQKITKYFNENKKYLLSYHHQDFPNLNAARTIYLYRKLEYAVVKQDSIEIEKIYARFQMEIIPDEPRAYSARERNSITKFSLETGKFFHAARNYEKAKKYYFNALEFSQSISYNFGILQCYWILSTLGNDFQQWEDVIFYTKKAFQNSEIEKFNQRVTLQHNLGYAYFGKKQYEKAAEYFGKELDYYLSLGKDVNSFQVVQNLNEIGKVLLQIQNERPNRFQIEKAYSAYHLSSEIFSRLYRGGKFNDLLAANQDKINEGMLLCSVKLNNYFAETAEQIEVNNSDFLWTNFLRNRKGRFNKSVEWKTKMDSLLAQRGHFSLLLKDSLEISSKEKKSIQTELEKTNRLYESAASSLRKENPSFYRFSSRSFSIADIQMDLESNETMLRYILTDSLVFAFAITKNDLVLKQLPINKKELQTKIFGYLSDLKKIDPSFESKSEALYDELIRPMELDEHSRLTIVVDGFLNYLPFETLLNSHKKYLVENHAIAYSSSLKLWAIQNQTKDSTVNGLIAFSPTYNLDLVANTSDQNIQTLVRSGNYELIGAKKEAEEIHKIFQGKLFTSENATKTNFIRNSSKYDLLHLAMHAVIDENDPANSTLIFNNNEKLYLSKLYDLYIPAKLAVLSACNTGAGEIKNGEGVQSLSRAFTFAGVKSTVMSLWPVPDRQTSKLMISFYKNLKNGSSKDRALQLAKINYLENTHENKLKHPYYWAGFVVSGDVSPIVVKTTIWPYILIVGIIVLILFLVYGKKRVLKRLTAS